MKPKFPTHNIVIPRSMKIILYFFASCFCRGVMAQDSLQFLPPVSPGLGRATPLYVNWAAYEPQPYWQSELPQNLPYNLQWKSLRLFSSASIQGDWNDNISLVNQHPVGDFTVLPMLSLEGMLPLTGDNVLNLSLAAGYDAYLLHSEDSHFLITPGSMLDFKIRAGDVFINVHDRFSYVEDPSLYGNISGLAQLGGFFNDGGVNLLRQFGPVGLLLGYDHRTFLSSSSAFSLLNNNWDIGTARISIAPTAAVVTGLEAGGGDTYYSSGNEAMSGGKKFMDALSGYQDFAVGPFASWKITSRLDALFKAGFVEHIYDDPALTQGHSSIPGYYLNAEAHGKLNQKLSVYLEGGREETVSIDGALVQQWQASVGDTWEVIHKGLLTTSFRYENAHLPFRDSFDDFIDFAPDYSRVLFQAIFKYPFTPHLSASLTYNLIIKSASIHVAEYTLNDIGLALNYTF